MDSVEEWLQRIRGRGYTVELGAEGRLVIEGEELTDEQATWLTENAEALKDYLRCQRDGTPLPPAIKQVDWRKHATRIPDAYFDWIAPHLKDASARVLLFLMRRTYGWRKDADTISISQFCEGFKNADGSQSHFGTGLTRKSVVLAIRDLSDKGLIEVTEGHAGKRGQPTHSYRCLVHTFSLTMENPPAWVRAIAGGVGIPPEPEEEEESGVVGIPAMAEIQPVTGGVNTPPISKGGGVNTPLPVNHYRFGVGGIRSEPLPIRGGIRSPPVMQ